MYTYTCIFVQKCYRFHLISWSYPIPFHRIVRCAFFNKDPALAATARPATSEPVKATPGDETSGTYPEVTSIFLLDNGMFLGNDLPYLLKYDCRITMLTIL